MLEFTKLELKHIPLVKPYFDRQDRRINDCTLGSTLMWRDYFDSCFAIENDTIVFRVRYLEGEYAFSVPIGKDPEGMLSRVEEYCAVNGITPEFCTVPPRLLPMLKKRWPGLTAEDNRDWYDYLYNSQDIVAFAGRKYAHQRNHIHRFERDNPNWSFSRMAAADAEEVKAFYQTFLREQSKDDDSFRAEAEKIFEVLEHFDEYGFLGGILRVDGMIVGISMGEIVRDTLFIHVEKALVSYSGVYQKLVHCFANEFVTDEILYINREEDMGDPGLRQSKQSYHPIQLLEKHTVYIRPTTEKTEESV